MGSRLWSSLTAGTLAGAAPAEPSPPVPSVEQPARLTEPNREDEFPASGCDANGRLWVAWVSWDGKTDRVLVRRTDAEGPAGCVSGTATDCWRPAMARDGDGRLWITWAQQDGGNWDLWACHLAGDAWSDPQRLTENPGNDFGQQLAVDARGQLWLVWQAVFEQNFEIAVARVTPQGLQDLQNVSRHPASDWEPAIAADRQGGVDIGWDSYRTGNYDIFVCRLQEGRLSEPTAVTSSPDYEAHASLAVDHDMRSRRLPQHLADAGAGPQAAFVGAPVLVRIAGPVGCRRHAARQAPDAVPPVLWADPGPESPGVRRGDGRRARAGDAGHGWPLCVRLLAAGSEGISASGQAVWSVDPCEVV